MVRDSGQVTPSLFAVEPGNEFNHSYYAEVLKSGFLESERLFSPQGDTVFGFWMQTLADLELLDLELSGLAERFHIDPIGRTVALTGDEEWIRLRVAHLEKVGGKKTLYAELVDTYGDTNAYAFHNLYPYKGKFYPRIVRTLINSFGLKEDALILDPFNGSGTTTHEASLMGIRSVGVDITPMGVMLARLKDELPFLPEGALELSVSDLMDIFHDIEGRRWAHPNQTIHNLMLVLYFDTIDAFSRTSRYNRKGKAGLFIEKFNYVRDCSRKLKAIQKRYGLAFVHATILEDDALNLGKYTDWKEKFDAIITSPPYYFSIDYVGKDRLAYEYLGVDMKRVEARYLGMKDLRGFVYVAGKRFPAKVLQYYEDLRTSIELMYWALKPGGWLAIIVGDSTVGGERIPTTALTKRFCEEVGFRFHRLVFNPLLGARNRAIRGESIIICRKE